MTEIDRKFWYKNDKIMTGVLYGGVQEICPGTYIIITTSAKIFPCFRTLASSFLLAAVKLADERPSRVATPAREAPTGIPVQLLARPRKAKHK